MISYGRQDIKQTDIDCVVEVLRSDFLTQGPVVPQFEKTVADYCRAGDQQLHALAVNSATSALHIACLALDLKAGDWLWTTPITFVASANCARYCGASVDFVDIDPQTYNLCPKALRAKLMRAKAADRLPKIVVPVHLTGQPCDMQAIHQLSLEYGFKIIEDASHAVGGKYQGKPIGNCQFSDITIFSFHPVKIITTAEGGMALTKSDHLANRMALFRSHGMTRDTTQMTHEPHGAWYYQQIELGYNYRLTELQAALGLSQMTRLDDYVTTRQKLANNYRELLAELPITLPYQAAESYSAWHLYVIRLHVGTGKQLHKQVFDSLRSQGIGVNLHYIPVHTQPYYSALGQEVGYSDASFPLANLYYEEAISIPMYATLTFEQQYHVAVAIKTSLKDVGLL